MSEIASATLTVDLRALVSNWRSLRDQVAPSECAAVVKADAYGIGIEHAVPALAKAGCRVFFVAHLSEAVRTRAAAPGANIYVLNGLGPEQAAAFVAADVRPVLGSLDEVRDWAEQGGARPAAIHIDTGMNRLGLSRDDVSELAASGLADRLGPALLMSHLVKAEVASDPINARQFAAFEAVRCLFPAWPASLANSSGIFLPDLPAFDVVRPGYALYGGNPTPGERNPMSPVVRLQAPIIQVRTVESGDTVGYGAGWTATQPARLATLSIGYADGLPRSSGRTDGSDEAGLDRGAALVAGALCPLVGRVSMDLVVVDASGVEPGEARRGVMATIIGDELDLDEVGRRAGTIGYEILTGLGGRYARRYLGA